MTDIEVGQLLIRDTLAELALDNDKKMARRLAQHIVKIDVDNLAIRCHAGCAANPE